jgi:hypothetical protein
LAIARSFRAKSCGEVDCFMQISSLVTAPAISAVVTFSRFSPQTAVEVPAAPQAGRSAR